MNCHTLARMNDNIKLIINKRQVYHAGIVVLFIISSFISGYKLGKKWGEGHDVEVESTSFNSSGDYLGKNDAMSSLELLGPETKNQASEQELKPIEKLNDSKTSKVNKDLQDTNTSENFVASRNGTKFYPAGCKSANRIKTENRVYFSNKEEAIKAGLEEATSC